MIADDTRPIGARVSLDMIGSAAEDRIVSWSEHETMLYALGVGAGLGAPELELGFTTENSAGAPLRALPSFLSVLAQRVKPPAVLELDVGRLLHAEQRIEITCPLPAAGRVILRSTVETVLDKGSDAIVTQAASFRNADDGTQVGRSLMRIFVRGGGGFGGPRGSARPFAYPDRAPDARVALETRPEQALLYRLSGDRNRLHSDPAFALERGFRGPIFHGLGTYGFACRAIIAAAAQGDASRVRVIDGRFRKPVYPGDTLTTEIWLEPDGEVIFRMLDGLGEMVIERGTATITA